MDCPPRSYSFMVSDVVDDEDDASSKLRDSVPSCTPRIALSSSDLFVVVEVEVVVVDMVEGVVDSLLFFAAGLVLFETEDDEGLDVDDRCAVLRVEGEEEDDF